MTYRIAQDFEYVGNDYWRWSAWIEASEAELDRVCEVTWVLHPSFPQPHKVSKERSENFRIRTAGWGVFTLRAEVLTIGNETVVLKHPLRLEYPEDGLSAASKRQEHRLVDTGKSRTVFLSYSARDAQVASRLRADLMNAGLNVLDQTRIEHGLPINQAIDQMIAQSDTVIGLVSDDEMSPWVTAELEAAERAAKPILPVALDTIGEHHESARRFGGRLGKLQVLSVDKAKPDTGAITDAIGTLMHNPHNFENDGGEFNS